MLPALAPATEPSPDATTSFSTRSTPLFAGLRGDFPAELELFDSLGLDGLFTDQPDVAVAIRAGLPPCDAHERARVPDNE